MHNAHAVCQVRILYILDLGSLPPPTTNHLFEKSIPVPSPVSSNPAYYVPLVIQRYSAHYIAGNTAWPSLYYHTALCTTHCSKLAPPSTPYVRRAWSTIVCRGHYCQKTVLSSAPYHWQQMRRLASSHQCRWRFSEKSLNLLQTAGDAVSCSHSEHILIVHRANLTANKAVCSGIWPTLVGDERASL